jgi:hypothetical protein
MPLTYFDPLWVIFRGKHNNQLWMKQELKLGIPKSVFYTFFLFFMMIGILYLLGINKFNV